MNLVEKIITPQVLKTKAYSVADVSENILKLDAMESPTDIPEHLREAWGTLLKNVAVNRYPPATNPKLETKLREVFEISPEHGVLFGNGSDELIQILLLACARPNAVVLAPAPTFVMYEIGAKLLGMNYISVDTKADFSLNVPTMLDAIKKYQPALIFLATPNNPTGKTYPIKDLQAVIEAATGLVVLDEAYLAYSETSAKQLAEIYENVVVIRTLSKIGFAGLRFGYLFGKNTWINELNKVRAPYNVNVLTQTAIGFALEHYDEIITLAETIKAEREKLFRILAGWQECQTFPSQANFLVLRVPNSDEWFQMMKAQGVLVKNLGHSHPHLTNCLRLTVSNAAENVQMIAALENCRK